MALIVSPAWPEQISVIAPSEYSPVAAAGWQGFTDLAFIGDALLTLGLSAILGAVIAFHPANRESMAISEVAPSLSVIVSETVFVPAPSYVTV